MQPALIFSGILSACAGIVGFFRCRQRQQSHRIGNLFFHEYHQLALRNISANPFRCLGVVLCAGITAACFLAALSSCLAPMKAWTGPSAVWGRTSWWFPANAASRVEAALAARPADRCLDCPLRPWEKVLAVPGVADPDPPDSPGHPLKNACAAPSRTCSDDLRPPRRTSSVTPWLEKSLGAGLKRGRGSAGATFSLSCGKQFIRVYGSPVTLRLTWNRPARAWTPRPIPGPGYGARNSARIRRRAESPLVIPEGQYFDPSWSGCGRVRTSPRSREPFRPAFPDVKGPGGPEIFRAAAGRARRIAATGCFWSLILATHSLSFFVGLVFSNLPQRAPARIGSCAPWGSASQPGAAGAAD